jgi:TRAP-type mannitol/chloroaromatic compound transport system permease large subunit
MRKINSLISDSSIGALSSGAASFSQSNPLSQLAKKAQAHQVLQQFWAAAMPPLLSQLSFTGSLTNGQLTVYADSAIVASKIKLNLANTLTQLQDLQQNQAMFRECKVTAIVVKVQVKSLAKPAIKVPLKLSKTAASNLQSFAETLGESALSHQLKSLASKT